MVKQKESDDSLKGWPAIAKFLSQPVSTAKRWASEGMPVTRIDRYVAASPAELERWLTRGPGTKETVHIASPNADFAGGPETRLVASSQDSAHEIPLLI
jgi:hypothetical protein